MTASEKPRIGGVILAAGGSTRLGRPKQFLLFHGKSLLRHAAETMAASVCDPVIIVLGAQVEAAKREIADLPVRVALNRQWQTGISSSIKLGLKEMLSLEPQIDAITITLCDQPLIDSDVIDRLAERFLITRKPIVAAKYLGVIGVPSVFSREMFDQLADLQGDKGARDLIRDPHASVETIEIEEAAVDIDTADDIDRLN